MSLEIEQALITKILEEADIRSVVRQKVTKKFFVDDTCREMFSYLLKKYNKFGRVPSLKLLLREFPDFEPVDTDDDLMSLVEEIKNEKLYNDISKEIKEIADATRDDPVEGLERIRKAASKLSIMHTGTRDEDITKSTDEMLEDYEQIEKGEGALGILYPWQYLNDLTLGMQAGELIGLFARPKSMKTWLSLFIANWVHETYGLTVVFFSCEMPVKLIRRRLAALRAKVDYKAYRSGKLTNKEKKRFLKALKALKESPPFIICGVDGVGDAAITEIRAKCEEYQADLAIIDGFYFLMEEDSSRGFRVITRGMKKQIAEPLDIPVLATTQANREAEKVKDSGRVVAFGDSLLQDCDQLLHLIREPQHREAKELLITMPGLRESEGGAFTINAKPAYDFKQKHILEQDMTDLDDEEGSSILNVAA